MAKSKPIKKDDIFRETPEIQKAVITESKITESFTKVTIFLSNEDIETLENIRKKRLEKGIKRSEVDKSKLIREAINLLRLQDAGNT